MPLIDGVGQSKNTKTKLAQLTKIFSGHIAITSKVIQKHPYYRRNYLYIDATAGPGIYEGMDELGSPLNFASAVTFANIPHEAILIDQQEILLMQLRTMFAARYPNFNFNAWPGDYEELIPKILNGKNKFQLGLVFIDPNNDPDLETVRYVAEHRPCMEILLYVLGANLKRMGLSIANYIENTQKDCWLIREPQDKQQWTFMMGTIPLMERKFMNIGMFPISSRHGKAIFDKLALTHKEMEEQCRKLQIPLIARTENT